MCFTAEPHHCNAVKIAGVGGGPRLAQGSEPSTGRTTAQAQGGMARCPKLCYHVAMPDRKANKTDVPDEVPKRSYLDRLLCRPISPAVRARQCSKFLEALIAVGGVVTRAVEKLKADDDMEVSMVSLSSWRAHDPDFAEAWAEAVAIGSEVLEAEAHRRAVEGVDKPVTFQGDITATYKEYSDPLLVFLLKGAKPDKYNRQALQISGPGGIPIQIQRVERVIIDPAQQLEDDETGDEK